MSLLPGREAWRLLEGDLSFDASEQYLVQPFPGS